jgi:hypothetical protein
MASDHEGKLLSSEEKTFVERLAASYAPTPMTAAQRTAFGQALERRLARRARMSMLRPVALVATACAAFLMWLAGPYQGTRIPDGAESPEAVSVAGEGTVPSADEENLLTYAYYSSDFYDDENDDEDEENLLPDEYEALAAAFALPEA